MDERLFIGLVTVRFYLHGNDSLKGKRRIATSLKQKIRNGFNVSVAEVGTAESLELLNLLLSAVSNDQHYLEAKLNKCLLAIERMSSEEIIYSNVEIFPWDIP